MINFKRLKDLREDNDLSQYELSKVLNVKRSAYSLWEIGNNIIPIEHLISFSNYFNVSIDYVLSLTDKKNKSNYDFNLSLIGSNVKNIRTQNNLTQEAFGKMLGITQAGVARIEKGKGISTLTIYKIATIFNKSIDSILK